MAQKEQFFVISYLKNIVFHHENVVQESVLGVVSTY